MMRLIVVVGWLIALNCCALAQAPSGQGVSGKSPPVTEQSPAQEEAKPDPLQFPIPVPIQIIPDPQEAEHTKGREEKSDKHEADDLEAQRKAADAAERSAIVAEWQKIPTVVQIVFGTLGTLGLIASLLLSGYSSILTKKTLELTQRNSERELRPYVMYSQTHGRVVHIFDTDEIVVEQQIMFKVMGVTPAVEVKYWRHDPVFIENGSPFNIPLETPPHNELSENISGTIVPDVDQGTNPIYVKKLMVDRLLKGEGVMFFVAGVQYRDVLENTPIRETVVILQAQLLHPPFEIQQLGTPVNPISCGIFKSRVT